MHFIELYSERRCLSHEQLQPHRGGLKQFDCLIALDNLRCSGALLRSSWTAFKFSNAASMSSSSRSACSRHVKVSGSGSRGTAACRVSRSAIHLSLWMTGSSRWRQRPLESFTRDESEPVRKSDANQSAGEFASLNHTKDKIFTSYWQGI